MDPTFIQHIRTWVAIDTQLKTIQEKIMPLRERKRELVKEIATYVQNNQLQKKRIDIHDGNLGFYDKKEYSALTYGYIEKCLGEIIPDKTHVEYIMNYLKEHRDIRTTVDIRRTYNDATLNRTRSKSISEQTEDT